MIYNTNIIKNLISAIKEYLKWCKKYGYLSDYTSLAYYLGQLHAYLIAMNRFDLVDRKGFAITKDSLEEVEDYIDFVLKSLEITDND